MSDIRSGENIDLNNDRSYSSQCLENFITEVGSEITGACMVPLNLPDAEVRNIIKRAVKWFRKNYEYSLRENYFHIPQSVFESASFKSSRTLHFPEENSTTGAGEIFSIYGVYDLGSGWNQSGGGMDLRFQSGADFAVDKLLFQNAQSPILFTPEKSTLVNSLCINALSPILFTLVKSTLVNILLSNAK